MRRDATCRIKKGSRISPMDCAHRIICPLVWSALKDRQAISDLDKTEVKRLTN